MSLKTFGAQANTYELQAGWTIDQDFTTELLTGQCVFKCSLADALSGEFRRGRKHPKDERLVCIAMRIVGEKAEKVSIQADYFGLMNTPTRKIWSFYNATNEEPIETHPDFSTFAGTKDSPQTGAIFDEDTGEFFGFSSAASSDLIGVRGYLDGKPTLRATWYSDKALSGIETVMDVYTVRSGAIPGLPAGTTALKYNWGSRPIGPYYEIWEEYQISGRNGWSETIYGAPVNNV